MQLIESDSFGGASASAPRTEVYGRINSGYKPRLRKEPPPNPEIKKRPIYLCPELGRTCTRPGCYEAYDLPSLYAGVRKPYRFSESIAKPEETP
jgi:hypothetical protein